MGYLQENTNIRIVFPKNELIEFRHKNSNTILYHKLDTHWNNAGAYIGADCLANELGLDLPDLETATLEEYNFKSSDLTNLLGMPIKDASRDYSISNYGEQSTQIVKWDYASFIYHTDVKNKNLYVAKDSFASALAPHIATQYENSYFVMADNLDVQDMLDCDTDVLVYEIVERCIDRLATPQISLTTFEIENVGGMKNILVKPTVQNYRMQYVSIFKKTIGQDEWEAINVLRPFDSMLHMSVPEAETGEVAIYVFGDENGQNLWDERVIEY